MDITGVLRVLRRNLLVIVACVVVGVVAGVVVGQLVDPLYESRARVIVASAQSDAGDAAEGARLAADQAGNYVAVVESQLVASRVVGTLQEDPTGPVPGIGELMDHVSASVVEGSAVLELRYTDPDPARAQTIAQAYAEALVAQAGELEQPEGRLAADHDHGARLRVVRRRPDHRRPDPDPLIGLAAGVLVAMVVVAVRQRRGTVIASPTSSQAITSLPILGTVPHESSRTRGQLVTDLDPNSPRAEAHRVLRTNVQFLDLDSEHKVLVVTSSVQEEGKSTTAVSLALTLARAGLRTLIVDGDLRRPSVAPAFGIDGSDGVTTVLLGKVSLEEAVRTHEATGLDVLPSGVVPPNAAELLQTRAMQTLMTRLRGDYEVVVVDTAPLLPVTDAALLASRSDATILVVRHGTTTREQVAAVAGAPRPGRRGAGRRRAQRRPRQAGRRLRLLRVLRPARRPGAAGCPGSAERASRALGRNRRPRAS